MPRNRLPFRLRYSPTGRRNHGKPLKRLLDTWDRNGSTSGPTPWQIYDDDNAHSNPLGKVTDRFWPIVACARNVVGFYTSLYLTSFRDLRCDIPLSESRVQLCSNVYVYIVVIQSVTNKQFVVFANSEILPSCLQSHRPARKLHTFWMLQVSAELIVYSVIVWNAYCWILRRRFSEATVCLRYLRDSVWRDLEWFDLADGFFGVESLLVKQMQTFSVAATVCLCYNSRLPKTKFIVHSFS